jgi:hypothetical protein
MIIKGLSKNQRKHADAIWNLDATLKVKHYVYSQTGKNWIDANVALHMMLAEALDECTFESDENFTKLLRKLKS